MHGFWVVTQGQVSPARGAADLRPKSACLRPGSVAAVRVNMRRPWPASADSHRRTTSVFSKLHLSPRSRTAAQPDLRCLLLAVQRFLSHSHSTPTRTASLHAARTARRQPASHGMTTTARAHCSTSSASSAARSCGRQHHRVVSCLDDANGIAHRDGDACFAEILRQYRASTPIRRTRVGRTTAEQWDAVDSVGFGARWMEQHLQPTA